MRASVQDWVSLYVLKVAKARRRKYVDGQEREFYEEFFTERDPEACALDVRRTLRNEELGFALAKCGPAETVVDLGCGVGDLLRVLPPGLRRIGIDLSLPALRYAGRDGARGAGLINSSLYDLPLADGAADVVISLEVLEHLQRDDRALEEIARILRPGGRVILSVPGTFYFPEYLDMMGHWRHYTRATLVEKLTRFGLRPERWLESYGRFNRWYFYVYLALWALASVARRVTGRPVTIYSMRSPFDRRPLYSRLAPALLRLASRLSASDRRNRAAGLFLVGVKAGSEEGAAAAGETASSRIPSKTASSRAGR